MAKIKQGILGGFSGKVANVVGTSWKGRAVMKSQPLSVANPRTEAQQEQRGKFSKIAELASTILTQFVQPVENPISGNISGYNLFCKDNKSAFSALGALVAANFFVGGGKIASSSPSIDATDPENDSIDLTWVNAEDVSAIRLTDKAYAVAVSEDGSQVFVSSGSATRQDEIATLGRVKGDTALASSQKYVIALAFVSADGRDVSVKSNGVAVTLAV